MVLSSFPKLSVAVDTTFRKDLTLQGCTVFTFGTARLIAYT